MRKVSRGLRLLRRMEARMLDRLRRGTVEEFKITLAFLVGAKEMYAVQRHLKR
jgi:hypothetical protein